MKKDASSSPAGMNIVSKTGLLLNALHSRGELSPAELSDELDEPMSSVYRLISNLEALGWVERGTRRGMVRLGLGFITLGRSLEGQFDIRRLALPQLRALTAATGETAVLVIRRGWFVVSIERNDGTEVLSQSFRLGESHPLHKSAASRAVLAFETPTVIDGFFAAAETGDDAALADVEPTLLRRQLQEIRGSGTSFSDSDVNPGIAAIGAPVFNHRGEVIAALSISGMRDRVLRGGDDLVDAVQAAADAVSTAMGHLSAGRETVPVPSGSES